MRWVLVALCGYFLVLHSARSYTEWSFWRLSHQAPMMELTELAFLQLSQRARHSASINSALKRKVDLDRELREVKKDPPVVLDATKRATALNEEYQRSGGQFEMFEEIMRLLNDVKRLRNEHQERIAAECDALEQQLRGQDGIIEESIRELEALGGKEEYLKDELQPLSWILKIRLGWEILFPTLFAVVAILMGILLPQAVGSSDWSLF
jgi:DNA repair exonuclease SbcCD ATPase subunit